MIELIKFIEQNSVQFVDFRFTDLVGKVHNVTYSADNIIDERELAPDLQTIFLDPFCVQLTAVVLCDHGSRAVAKKAYDYILSIAIADKVQFGFEIGFSIFDEVNFRVDPYNSHVSFSPVENYLNIKKQNRGSFDVSSAIDPLSDLRSEILLMMKESSIKNPLYHKKVSPFQGVIRVGNSSFIESADSIQKSKYVIRNVAHSYGKTATFMPKPVMQGEGNGLCLYQSLLRNNEDLFEKSENYRHYMGGIMQHIKAINAFSNPTTNSYKRLINLPNFASQSKLLFPDPTANSYLCFAAVLMAGIDGIKNKLSFNETAARSLSEALEALDKDREFLLQGDVFTNEQIDHYITVKCDEIKKVETAVQPAEFSSYYHI
ncbi:MAG: hypothetical protein QWI36_00385 [Wolbachia endosymbiont of Tyrophagus putrescentiae]|nr:hypothetical protein [Wolbachia endosymbiont of Tyrophagus putrescentiae]MDN5249772.1 hypothetical protein [Alphaproteobacteria bacterium]